MTERPPAGTRRSPHRRYVPYAHAHYGGALVDGAYTLGLFGDVATEVCIRTDGDEGLLAAYAEVQFLAPVQAGDVLEVDREVTRVGTRSRELRCTRGWSRGPTGSGASAAGSSTRRWWLSPRGHRRGARYQGFLPWRG